MIFPLRPLLPVLALVLLAGCTAEQKRQRALQRAEEHFGKGRFEQARIEYQNVLQKFPDDPVATERLATIWADRGANFRALGLLARVRKLSPGNTDAHLRQIRILLLLGAVRDARGETRGLLARQPSNEAALVLLAESVRDGDDWRDVEEQLKRFPNRSAAGLHEATALQQRFSGDREKAVSSLRRSLTLDPKNAEARARLAGFLAELGRAPDADKEFKTAAEAAPLRSLIRVRYAAHLIRTEKVDEAEAYLADLSKQAPDYLPAARARAELALFRQRPDDADRILGELVAKDPADGETRMLRSAVELSRGRAKEAVEALRKFGQDFPGFGIEKYQLALGLLRLEDTAGAVTALREYVSRFPDTFEAMLLLGQLQLRTGAAEAATQTLQILLGRRPDIFQGYPLLIEAAKAAGKLEGIVQVVGENLAKSPNSPLMWQFLGMARMALDQPQPAREAFARAAAGAPTLVGARLALLDLDLRERKGDAAAARAEEIIRTDPKLPVPRLALARARMLQQRWADGFAAALEALELEPRSGPAFALISQLLLSIPAAPEAIPLAERLLQKYPTSQAAAVAAAPALLRAGEVPRVRAAYEKVLESEPKALAVLNNLANLHADQLGRPADGLPFARRAHELEPKAPLVADTLAWLLHLSGDSAAALPVAEAAVKALPGHPELRYHFGAILAKLGRKEEALAALREALKFQGDFPGKSDAVKLSAALER